MNLKEAITFDDILLYPQYSDLESRSHVNLYVELTKGIKLSHPIIPANMKTIMGLKMAREIYNSGGMAILHRFIPIQEQIELVKELSKLPNWSNYVAVSIGVKDEDCKNLEIFSKLGIKIVCIDIAHLHSKLGLQMCQFVSKNYPDIFLIAGSVATMNGALDSFYAGVDCVKVNIGAGSICSTRIETGSGVPQITALEESLSAKQSYEKSTGKKVFIMSDGGAKSAGDLTKALCFSDLVMSGNLFAGCEETPGEMVRIDGINYKTYVGSSTHKTNRVEGVSGLVNITSNYQKTLMKLTEGIQSGCSYSGADSLKKLREKHKFIKITSAGWKESLPHDLVKIIK